MNEKVQIWLCAVIVIGCIIAYIVVGCIPWGSIFKKKSPCECEPFNCPVDILGDLERDNETKSVFIPGRRDKNKRMLNTFTRKFYGDDVESLEGGKEKEIVKKIKEFIKKNKINNAAEFDKKCA